MAGLQKKGGRVNSALLGRMLKAHHRSRRPYIKIFTKTSHSLVSRCSNKLTRRGEVPYRLNVASGGIALSSIAVEPFDWHLRLAKLVAGVEIEST
jgi:hypothetical protein